MMNPLRHYFVRKYGSPKGYLLVLMQLSVVGALLVSMLAAFSGDAVMALQVIPAALLVFSLAEFRRKWPGEFPAHAIIFGAIFAFSLFLPGLARSIFTGPFTAASNLTYALIALLLLMIILKLAFSRRAIEGRVIMVDGGNAVVKTDFDLLAGVKAGEWVVHNRGAKKGQRVKVSLGRGLFGQPKPDRITGVMR